LAQEIDFSAAYLLNLLLPAEAGNNRSKTVRTPATEECNKYVLTADPVFDWPIIMIDPGGLLLVVPTYLKPHPRSVLLWVGLQKSK
jgi:hypothetical protein